MRIKEFLLKTRLAAAVAGSTRALETSQAQSAHFSIDPGPLENSSSIIRDIVYHGIRGKRRFRLRH